jgi:hypothetical protein
MISMIFIGCGDNGHGKVRLICRHRLDARLGLRAGCGGSPQKRVRGERRRGGGFATLPSTAPLARQSGVSGTGEIVPGRNATRGALLGDLGESGIRRPDTCVFLSLGIGCTPPIVQAPET